MSNEIFYYIQKVTGLTICGQGAKKSQNTSFSGKKKQQKINIRTTSCYVHYSWPRYFFFLRLNRPKTPKLLDIRQLEREPFAFLREVARYWNIVQSAYNEKY